MKPNTFCVRISHNMNGGYDYYDKTLEELEDKYIIYYGVIISKTYAKKLLGLPNNHNLSWMDNDCLTNLSVYQLFNYELVSTEDREAFNYCKEVFESKK